MSETNEVDGKNQSELTRKPGHYFKRITIHFTHCVCSVAATRRYGNEFGTHGGVSFAVFCSKAKRTALPEYLLIA